MNITEKILQEASLNRALREAVDNMNISYTIHSNWYKEPKVSLDLDETWDEKRADVVGQNGNDGLHYDKEEAAGDYQIGGTHYVSAKIQPIDFIVKNKIPYREANIIKYVFRHRNKNCLEDLKKAQHYLEMLIEEYL